MTERVEVRVLIVDDHQLLAQSLALGLFARGFRAEVSSDLSPGAVLDHAQIQASDLVLLDLEIGGEIGDGTTLVAPLTARGHRVLVVSATEQPARFGAALAAGAVGYVSKSEPFEQLVSTIVAAGLGQQVITEREKADLVRLHRDSSDADRERLAPFEQLTAVEADVLRALARGDSVSRIAERRFVSEATVRTQVRAVLQKLGVTSQLEAVARARAADWE